MTSPAFDQLLPVLVNAQVQFILVGGLAGVVHGASRLTYDVNLVYARDRINLEKLAATLAPYHPYLRDAPPNLPFRLDVPTLREGLNFTLTTSLGGCRPPW